MKIPIETIIFGAIGFAITGGALIKTIGNLFFLHLSQRATGTVVYFKTGCSSNRHLVYIPVVEFAPVANHKIQFTSTTGANPPNYKIGDRVAVRFMRKNPRAGRIHSFWEMWALPAFFFVIGLIVLCVAFSFLPR